MNMQFLPGSNNMTPDLDEDDPARRSYLLKLSNLREEIAAHVRTQIEGENDNIGDISYLRQRVRFTTYLNIMLAGGAISEKVYIKLAGLQNGDILYHEDFQAAFHACDANGKSVDDYISQYSTW